MGGIACTEKVKVEMEKMWRVLDIPIQGCADVHIEDGNIFITQGSDAGVNRFDIIRAADGYHVYQMMTGNEGMCQCLLFHDLPTEVVDNALDIYSGILWERGFCVYTDYSGGEDQICVPIR